MINSKGYFVIAYLDNKSHPRNFECDPNYTKFHLMSA